MQSYSNQLPVSQEEDPTLKSKKRFEAIVDLIGARFAILAGAGISFDSGLPLGKPMTESILDNLNLNDAEKKELLAAISPDHITNFGWHNYLRFEDVFQAIQTFHDPSINVINALYSQGFPSKIHRQLALHLRNGNPVFTTNFDTLIEQAAPEIPTLITGDSCRSFIQEGSGPFIGKLHGTVNSLNYSDGIPCATINRIWSDFILNSWKWDLFASILQRMPLLVIGYSGSDDFDIMYALRQVSSNQPIIWIDHSSEKEPSIINWAEYIEYRPQIGSKKLHTFLRSSFRQAPCRNLNQCYLISGKTTKILEGFGLRTMNVETDQMSQKLKIPKLPMDFESSQLIKAELFNRLYYCSWSLSHIRKIPAISKSNLLKAKTIESRALTLMLRLNEAEDVLKECIVTSSLEMSLEYYFRLAEISAFRFICYYPLKRLGFSLPDPDTVIERLMSIVSTASDIIQKLQLSKHQYDDEQLVWIERRLSIFKLFAYCEKEKDLTLTKLLNECEVIYDSALIDPFTLGIIYILNFLYSRRERPITDIAETFVEEANYRKQKSDTGEVLPKWRTRTYIPFWMLNLYDYVRDLFEFTDEQLWTLALDLFLWDDEFRERWDHFSYQTAFTIYTRLSKTGVFIPTLLISRFFPDKDDPWINEVLQLFEAHKKSQEISWQFVEFDNNEFEGFHKILQPEAFKMIMDFIEHERDTSNDH